MFSKPPKKLVQNYYNKAFEWKGIYVLANKQVPKEALARAAEIIFNALAMNPEIAANLAAEGCRFVIIPDGVGITRLPEYSNLDKSWDQYRGLGGLYASAGEENLMNYPSDPYRGEESIALHEWMHSVHFEGIGGYDNATYKAIKQAYKNAKAEGLWNNTYAKTNFIEYFAETAQAYFDDNPNRAGTDGIHNSINTRAELKVYDPVMYKVLKSIFGNTDWTAGKNFGTGQRDKLVGTTGDDLFFGEGGNDLVKGGKGDDYAFGGKGADKLVAGLGADILRGDQGNDTLLGARGDDALFGGPGTDRLAGGPGDDTLSSGPGRDKLIFKGSFGADTITDFKNNKDTIQISKKLSPVKSIAKLLDAVCTMQDGDAVLDFGHGNVLTVENTLKVALLDDIELI